MSIIDEELAKAFLDDPENVDLSEATGITAGAAEALSKCEGYVSLGGLTKLSDTAAEALSKHQGQGGLDLGGLHELSDAAIESLSKHQGQGGLNLGGLHELSDAAVESLSKHQGELALYGLTELSDAAAESLSSHKGDLSLDGLAKLSDAAAESLSKYQGGLFLTLHELSDAAAESLSSHEGELTLGLSELSDAAAESLSKHQGNLYLNDLTKLSDAVAESLSRPQGGLYLLSLGGLSELSDAAAESLSRHQGILSLDGPSELSDAAAESLSKHQGILDLNGLYELSDAAAESLSSHEGELSLDGLSELSDAAAESLSRHQGKINGEDPKEWVESLRASKDAMSIIDENLAKKFLDGVGTGADIDLSEATEITDEAAEILGQCDDSWVRVDGLKSLSVVAAGHLSSAGALSFKGLEELDEDVATQLARNGFSLELNGVRAASDAVMGVLSKFEGDELYLNGLCDVSDDAIKALADTKAGLDLSSLCAISDDALELLVRGRRTFLSLGLQQLSEEQARILEFFHGENLALDSVGEISDTVAESLARISSERLSLGGLHDFSESVAKRLGSLATDELTLPGALRISRAALEKLLGAHFRDGSSKLLLTGKILLPDYAPEYPGQVDAYERVYTESVINRKRMREWLAEDPKYRSPSIRGGVLTLPAAEFLGSSGATQVEFHLQGLPDNVAEALEKHTGDLTLGTDSLTPFAARCLAQRKFRKNTPWRLCLILDRLEAAEAAELARTRYPLEINIRGAFPAWTWTEANSTPTSSRVNSISDGAAEALSNYEGDSLNLGVAQLSDAAAKSLSKYQGRLSLDRLA